MTDETPEMPPVAPPVWAAVPASLAARQQWLLWKFESKPGQKKPGKIPYYVGKGRRTGDQGSDRDRERLATLDVVRRAFEREQGKWAGIGFAFLPDDGLIGIDIDGAIDRDTAEPTERCRNIIASCSSYTERSPSGTGVHIIVEGTTHTNKSNDIGLEVFCGKQFFTFTANRWPETPAEVTPIAEQTLRRLHMTIDEAKALHKAAKVAPPTSAPSPAAQPASGGRSSADDFRTVNDSAMANFHAWVPALFPHAIVRGTGYRVTSKALGRDLQEDISIAPEGICDFGVADMGDARGGSRTAVDLVLEWGGHKKPAEALHWLADILGVTIAKPGRAPKPPAANVPAAAGQGSGGGGGKPPAGALPDGGEEDAPGAYDRVMAALRSGRSGPLDCRENVLYCLQNDPRLDGLVRRNDFTRLIERSRETPWGHPVGEWTEEDDLMLGEYMFRKYGLGIKGKNTLRDGVVMAARLSCYNPIVDWIRAEPWDGVERLEHWLTDIFEIEDRPYTRLIGKFFMMGLVKRAIDPGCKFDYMLILKGEQGLKKSGVWRSLAFPYFTDNAIRIGDKDSQMAQQLAWIVESAELESLNKSETTLIKQHLSAQEDWYRPPYGTQMVKAPRHSVHVGTTNADTFLKDATGDRRMWPLEVKIVHHELVMSMRSQLLAEALHRIEAEERYWPTREEEKEFIFPEHEQFRRSDPWEDLLDEYVNADVGRRIEDAAPKTRTFFPSTELYETALGIKADRIDGNGQMDTRIVNSMKALGFERYRETAGRRRRGYRRLPVGSGGASAPSTAPGQPPAVGEDDADLPF